MAILDDAYDQPTCAGLSLQSVEFDSAPRAHCPGCSNDLRELVRLHLNNEDERLAMTKMFAEHAITRDAWMDHGTATDRMRKALEKQMRALLGERTEEKANGLP